MYAFNGIRAFVFSLLKPGEVRLCHLAFVYSVRYAISLSRYETCSSQSM